MAEAETSSSSSNSSKKPKKSAKNKLLGYLLVVVVLVLAGGSVFLYSKYSETKKEVEKLSTIQGQQELSKTQTQALLGEVKAIAIVPTDSGDPTVATIIDATKLKDKEFYKNVENNDQVLAFQKDKKITIYIYRPSTKQIVNMGTFQLDEKAQPQQPAASSTQ